MQPLPLHSQVLNERREIFKFFQLLWLMIYEVTEKTDVETVTCDTEIQEEPLLLHE